MVEKQPTNVQEAVKYLAHHLVTDGAAYNEPTPQLYTTTISLILLIHIIFVWQLKQKKTKRHVAVSYDQIVRRKQFHKLFFWAILSHPSPDDVTTTTTPVAGLASNDGQGSGSILPMWSGTSSVEGQNSAHSRSWNNRINNYSIMHQLQSFGIIVASRIQNQVIRPLFYGPLAGLPLLTYISHVIWQCRALEEVYDYRTDSANIHIMNNSFNVSSIIQNDLIVRDYIQETNFSSTLNNNHHIDSHSKSEGKLSSDNYEFQYYRVLVALTLIAYLTDFFITYLSLRYIKSRHQQHDHDQQQLIQHPSQQNNNFTPTQNTIFEYLSHRGVCTLTPLCTAVLVLYVHHFPSTPISVLPFIRASFIFGSSPDLSFIASIIILIALSYKIYPLMSIFYGCTSGLLWVLGWTQFLADRYWGCMSMILASLLCAMSFKVELMSGDERNHGVTRNIWRGLLSWLDYVCWDVDGVIRL